MQDSDKKEAETHLVGTKCDCKHNKDAVHYIDEKDRDWENMDQRPHDVYITPPDAMFASDGFDIGENYPRGV